MEIKEGILNNLLCMSCLCVGRYIQEVKEERLKQYYVDLLKEIPLPVNLPSPLLCWECEALLRRVVAFREQVKDSYRILQTYTKENFNECLQSDVSRSPRLKVIQQKSIDIPPEGAVKIEVNEGELSLNKCSNSDSEVEPEEVQTVICDVQRRRKITHNGRRGRVKQDERDPMSTQDDVKSEPLDDIFIDKTKIETFHVELKTTPKKERKRKVNQNKSKPPDIDFIQNGTNEIDLKIEDSKDITDSENLKTHNKLQDSLAIKDKADTKCSKNHYRTVNLSYDEIQAERENLRREESFTKSLYKCDSCIVVFNNDRSLKIHNKKRHSISGKYICSICNINFTGVDEFRSHYRLHTLIYECTVCKNRFATLKDVQRHLKDHGIYVKEYKCQICGYVSNSAATQRYHKDKNHSNKPRIECGDCDKTFSHRAGLLNHRLTFHEYQNKFPCNICNKIFRWKTSLKRHFKKHNESKDTRSKAFCAKCDIVFSSVCSLQRHLRNSLKHVTSDQLKFICDHCNHRFADKTKLRDHIEEKHLFRRYECHVCHKPSKNRVGMEQHIRTVHKGRPNNRMCHHCGKGFPTKVQLESHIRTHTGERPFMCEYCPTTFSQQSNLYKHHRQVHLNIKSKRYPLCKKRKDVTQDVAVFPLPVYMPENGFAI